MDNKFRQGDYVVDRHTNQVGIVKRILNTAELGAGVYLVVYFFKSGYSRTVNEQVLNFYTEASKATSDFYAKVIKPKIDSASEEVFGKHKTPENVVNSPEIHFEDTPIPTPKKTYKNIKAATNTVTSTTIKKTSKLYENKRAEKVNNKYYKKLVNTVIKRQRKNSLFEDISAFQPNAETMREDLIALHEEITLNRRARLDNLSFARKYLNNYTLNLEFIDTPRGADFEKSTAVNALTFRRARAVAEKEGLGHLFSAIKPNAEAAYGAKRWATSTHSDTFPGQNPRRQITKENARKLANVLDERERVLWIQHRLNNNTFYGNLSKDHSVSINPLKNLDDLYEELENKLGFNWNDYLGEDKAIYNARLAEQEKLITGGTIENLRQRFRVNPRAMNFTESALSNPDVYTGETFYHKGSGLHFKLNKVNPNLTLDVSPLEFNATNTYAKLNRSFDSSEFPGSLEEFKNRILGILPEKTPLQTIKDKTIASVADGAKVAEAISFRESLRIGDKTYSINDVLKNIGFETTYKGNVASTVSEFGDGELIYNSFIKEARAHLLQARLNISSEELDDVESNLYFLLRDRNFAIEAKTFEEVKPQLFAGLVSQMRKDKRQSMSVTAGQMPTFTNKDGEILEIGTPDSTMGPGTFYGESIASRASILENNVETAAQRNLWKSFKQQMIYKDGEWVVNARPELLGYLMDELPDVFDSRTMYSDQGTYTIGDIHYGLNANKVTKSHGDIGFVGRAENLEGSRTLTHETGVNYLSNSNGGSNINVDIMDFGAQTERVNADLIGKRLETLPEVAIPGVYKWKGKFVGTTIHTPDEAISRTKEIIKNKETFLSLDIETYGGEADQIYSRLRQVGLTEHDGKTTKKLVDLSLSTEGNTIDQYEKTLEMLQAVVDKLEANPNAKVLVYNEYADLRKLVHMAQNIKSEMIATYGIEVNVIEINRIIASLTHTEKNRVINVMFLEHLAGNTNSSLEKAARLAELKFDFQTHQAANDAELLGDLFNARRKDYKKINGKFVPATLGDVQNNYYLGRRGRSDAFGGTNMSNRVVTIKGITHGVDPKLGFEETVLHLEDLSGKAWTINNDHPSFLASTINDLSKIQTKKAAKEIDRSIERDLARREVRRIIGGEADPNSFEFKAGTFGQTLKDNFDGTYSIDPEKLKNLSITEEQAKKIVKWADDPRMVNQIGLLHEWKSKDYDINHKPFFDQLREMDHLSGEEKSFIAQVRHNKLFGPNGTHKLDVVPLEANPLTWSFTPKDSRYANLPSIRVHSPEAAQQDVAQFITKITHREDEGNAIFTSIWGDKHGAYNDFKKRGILPTRDMYETFATRALVTDNTASDILHKSFDIGKNQTLIGISNAIREKTSTGLLTDNTVLQTNVNGIEYLKPTINVDFSESDNLLLNLVKDKDKASTYFRAKGLTKAPVYNSAFNSDILGKGYDKLHEKTAQEVVEAFGDEGKFLLAKAYGRHHERVGGILNPKQFSEIRQALNWSHMDTLIQNTGVGRLGEIQVGNEVKNIGDVWIPQANGRAGKLGNYASRVSKEEYVSAFANMSHMPRELTHDFPEKYYGSTQLPRSEVNFNTPKGPSMGRSAGMEADNAMRNLGVKFPSIVAKDISQKVTTLLENSNKGIVALVGVGILAAISRKPDLEIQEEPDLEERRKIRVDRLREVPLHSKIIGTVKGYIADNLDPGTIINSVHSAVDTHFRGTTTKSNNLNDIRKTYTKHNIKGVVGKVIRGRRN